MGGTEQRSVEPHPLRSQLVVFYEDLIDPSECHGRDATAVTPVSLFRLSRTNFLALIHRHPTLVLQLLSKQHNRLQQQRTDARHFY